MNASFLDKLSPRELSIALGCALVLIIAAIALYVVKPLFVEYRSLAEQHELLAGIASTGNDVGAEINRLQQKLDALEQRLLGDSANLPLEQMESFVVGRLQTISWRHGIELESIEPSAGEHADDYQELLFRVAMSGDYFAIGSWLEDVANELGFVVVKEYQISVAGGDDALPVLGIRLLLASYRVEESS